MKISFRLLAVGTLGFVTLVGSGCNKTTKDDVVSAKRNEQEEQRRLEDIKRENAQDIEEAQRHTANKPVVTDDRTHEVAETVREARERKARQEQRVAEAKAKTEETKDKLTAQVDRDKLVAEARLHIDAANRAVEKLEAKRNAADDAGKAAIDDQIKEIKHRRDLLDDKIDALEGEEAQRDFMGKTLMVKKATETCGCQERWNRNSKVLKNEQHRK